METSFENFFRQETNPVIKKSDTGNYVIILQEKLKNLGFYYASITGSFDDYTNEVVMDFQETYGLNPNGIVDSETWETLYSLIPQVYTVNPKETRPTLRIGDSGSYVIELQTILKSLLYYVGTIDGVFGKNTENAVKEFQTNNKLTADGIVGRDTWSALATLYSPLAICENGTTGGDNIYTVVSGDTLYSIARRYNTTVDEIKRLNNLTSNILQIGQQLIIPSTTNDNIYTVVSGDTLYSIARRYNTTVDEIKRLNNLTSNILQIGQQLIIR